MPSPLDETMPRDCDQQCLDGSLSEVLNRVPQLRMYCARLKALKELRLVCQLARAAATTEITRLTIDFKEPHVSDGRQRLYVLLQGCSIRSLSVVLHTNLLGQLETDLAEFVTALAPCLTNVTSLNLPVVLEEDIGEDDHTYNTRLYNGPARFGLAGIMTGIAVRVLIRACGTITNLTITGSVLPECSRIANGGLDLLPLLQALNDVSATANLKILRIGILRESGKCDIRNGMLWINLGDVRDAYPEDEYKKRERFMPMLHGLHNLAILELRGSGVINLEGWRALPPSLQRLELKLALCPPPPEMSLSLLQHFVMDLCESDVIAQLLHIAPALRSLTLQFLAVKTCSRQNLADLSYLFEHCLVVDSDAVPNSTAALQLQQQHISTGTSETPLKTERVNVLRLSLSGNGSCEMALWDFLASLPEMTSVLGCHLNFYGGNESLHFNPDVDFACLRHLPRVLPCINTLTSSLTSTTDESVAALSPLTALRRWKVYSHLESFGQDRIADWQLLLPGLVDFEVY